MLCLFIGSALVVAVAMAAPTKVAIVGATGKVGRSAVQQLVDRGYKARILLRHDLQSVAPTSMPGADAAASDVASYLASLPGVETVVGDVTDIASCQALLSGCSACLALHGARRTRKFSDLWSNPENEPGHSKQVNYLGIANLLAAARASGTCNRLVRLTGKGETPWSIFSILINGMGSMAKAWNYEGEQLLRAADDIEYTIIRPGIMQGDVADLAPSSLALADDGGDLKVTSIPHASIAALAIDVFGSPNAARATLCAMTTQEAGAGADSWSSLLTDVKPDRRAFRDDLLEEHFLATRVGGGAIVAILALLGGALVSAAKGLFVALAGVLTNLR